jgi:hypothetical protein
VSRNFYLSEETLETIRVLSEHLHVSQAQVVERSVSTFGREQAMNDWATLREWWHNQPAETKRMLWSLAVNSDHSDKKNG